MTIPRAIKFLFALVAGFVVWFVVATLANMLIRALLPGYAEAELATRFTLHMLIARLVVGGVSSVAAGFACALSARSVPVVVKVFAAALVLFFIPVHYSLWTQFPLWYHAIFLVSLAPLVLVGARIARRVASEVAGGAPSAEPKIPLDRKP